MSQIKAANLKIISYMILNFLSSCGIIWANKLAYQAGFTYATTLTCLHFLATFVGLEISAHLGLFEKRILRISSVLPISFFFCGFVVLNNLSLKFNPVGVYQLLKVMTTPVIVALQFLLYRTALPLSQAVSLIPVCVGVSLATAANFDANARGLVYGVAAIVSTSVYQIMVKSVQDKLKCGPEQLLYYQSGVSGLMLMFACPIADGWFKYDPSEVSHRFLEILGSISKSAWFYVVLSSVLAFIVNLSIFLVIRNTSPVTYNVLGHGKLVVLLLSGYLLFGEHLGAKHLTGITLTVFGIVWYSHLKLRGTSGMKNKKNL